MPSTVNVYKSDLAHIHDNGFGHFARSAAPCLLEFLRQEGKARGLVVDLGCGSGIFAQELFAAGYDVLGIDISEAMIALARTRVPQGEFRTGSYLTAKLPPCVAVTAVGECFNYLFDQSNTEEEILRLFRRIYNALQPGGLLMFDVATPGRVPGSGSHRHYHEEEEWVVLMTAKEDKHRQLLTRRITTFRKVGELYRRDCELHQLRLFVQSEVAEQLQNVGFCVRLLASYGQLHFAPGHIAFLAQKP